MLIIKHVIYSRNESQDILGRKCKRILNLHMTCRAKLRWRQDVHPICNILMDELQLNRCWFRLKLYNLAIIIRYSYLPLDVYCQFKALI